MTLLAMQRDADAPESETHEFPLKFPLLVDRETTADASAAEIQFDALLKFVQGAKSKTKVHYTSEADLLPTFMEILPCVKVVSFDIFDTVLVRYVDHSVDVFFHLEQHSAFAAHIFKQPVSRLRINAERAARALVKKMIASEEVNLLEIYQVFCDLNGISRELAPGFVAAEEEIELRLCTATPAIQRLYAEAVLAGKRVIFVSDTYHDTDFLARLLTHVGYPVGVDSIFASSDARKAKQSGDLFPQVLAAIGVAPEEVLHLGDHPVSDYQRGRSAGMQCILHSQKTSREHADLLNSDGGPKQRGDDAQLSQRSLVRGIRHMVSQVAEAHGQSDNFWWKFGYSSAGPLTVGYSQWLEQAMRADGMEHAYFLLRDGELLYKVYQCLYGDDPNACPASCLDSSRRATLLPVLEIAPGFAIPSLLGGIGKRPVREYLDRLGVCADDFEAEAKIAGLESLDELIDSRFNMDPLVLFLIQQPVLNALLARSRKERDALTDYLAQEQLTTRKQVALVDLGWGGTIHKSLQLLLMKIAPATRVTGYYMATFPEAPHSILPNVAVQSYLAHRGEPARVYQQIISFLNLFETVYSSTAGSLLYFEKASSAPGTQAVAVRQESDKSEEQCGNLLAMHAGALAFAEDFRRITGSHPYPPMSPQLAAEEFFRVIDRPTAEEAYLLGGLVHCDNLGSSSTHISARLRSTDNPEELLEDYREVHWKKGLLALPSAETATLRTLLWLMETEFN